jgi:hypothetical protein
MTPHHTRCGICGAIAQRRMAAQFPTSASPSSRSRTWTRPNFATGGATIFFAETD